MANSHDLPGLSITIPAEYLEDVRSAIVAEVDTASDAVRVDHAAVLKKGSPPCAREDRSAAVRILREDMQLLDQVFAADGKTTVSGERDALAHTLGETVRVLSSRLADACEYEPVDMGVVLDLVAAVRWAASEAIRIVPSLDDRKAA